MIALKIARERGAISEAELKAKLVALAGVPAKLRRLLGGGLNEQVMQMARCYRYASNFLYLGRGFCFPVALEGALKLKEISYASRSRLTCDLGEVDL